MATHADEGDALSRLTPRELRIRKAFVGLDLAAIKALQALHPWMEAHVHEVVEEFYAHLLRFQQPRWLLADPQRLARVKAAQTDSLLAFTGGRFDLAYVASRLIIGRTHARVGVTPQWHLGAYSAFARILFPKILMHYQDRPLTGVAAIKALIAVMHLDMQLAIDAYLEASEEALQQHATQLEDEVARQTSALEERARQLETLYLVSATASQQLDLAAVLEASLPIIVDTVGAGLSLLQPGAYACVGMLSRAGGMSSAASTRIAGAMVRRSVTIGGTRTGLRGASGVGASRSSWSDTAKVRRHQSAARVSGSGAPTISPTGSERGSHPRLYGSTGLDRLASALRAGASASPHVLPGGLWCPGAGTA